ncbi:sensor histidine kinase [Paenibacillus sp. GCM10012307]|uniref:Sensor histidine kinase n=1 Tax=Paenibacillus roseus TaxID=2798579 RepID=A0A934J3U8_9BACL|nr:sensor histidine kinase [Paenibacillus roseus]MBJ6361144.1 sensor histidine kinase [Paenibacillus roseus]
MSYFKKLPITTQLLLLLSLIVLVMVSIMAANYFRAVEVIKENNSNYMQGIISQQNQSLSSNSNDIKKIIDTVAYNEQTVQNYLNVTDPVERLEAYNQLKSYLSDMRGMKEGILDIALVGKNGSYFNMKADTDQLAGIAQDIPEKVLYYFDGLQELTIANATKWVLIAGAKIYSTTDFTKGENELGTVLVAFDVGALFGNGDSIDLSNRATIYMTDRNGRVFYTNDKSLSIGGRLSKAELLDGNEQYLIKREPIPDFGGEIVIAMPNHVLLQGLNDIRKQQLFMVAIAIGFLIIPLLFVINNILQPLKKLMMLMSEVRMGQKNHLRKRIEVDGYAEMIIMATRFNDMMAEIEGLTERLLDSKKLLYETELVKRQAELSYLQSQINPHFLYNTLESIKGLAADEGSSKIFELTKALALFFRFSIKGSETVSLDRELTIIKNYVYIQQIRFGERLQVEYDFSAASLDCAIPKMILQPIVENAINHGIEPLERNGLLVIKSYTEGDNLYLSVQDNGSGMHAERLEDINKSLEMQRSERDDRSSESSIGLMNVHDRLRIKYGEAYGIWITSNIGCGTRVLLKLPIGGERNV